MSKSWRSLADLLTEDRSPVSLIGAALGLASVTPGACDKGPEKIRAALRRTGTYDVERRRDLKTAIHDQGDLAVAALGPGAAFSPIRDAVAQVVGRAVGQAGDQTGEAARLAIILGGNNAVTRPGVHGLGEALSQTGLVTLDAHLDMRDTSEGLSNGNPVQALLDDGLPGANIVQIGIAPFANARYMHEAADCAGNTIFTLADCAEHGVGALMTRALSDLSSRCDRIYVDFDIDVIERCLSPGAPGGRPGGLTPAEFFAAARLAGACPKVRAVDLTEFDPSLDVSDITALIAARWCAEILTGYEDRQG